MNDLLPNEEIPKDGLYIKITVSFSGTKHVHNYEHVFNVEPINFEWKEIHTKECMYRMVDEIIEINDRKAIREIKR